MTVILFSRLQQRRRPFRLVGRIGIFLRLQTDGRTMTVHDTFLSGQCAIQEVTGINLNARLVGIDIKHNTRQGDSRVAHGRVMSPFVLSTQLWS